MEEENKKEVEKKLTYEQLEQIALNQQRQLQNAYRQIENLIKDATYKRLDYLFKILERKDCFIPEFVTTCIMEIEQIMTIPEESKVEEDIEEHPKKEE